MEQQKLVTEVVEKADSKPSLITRIRNRYKDRSGQSTTEYILILAIVVMIASKMRGKLNTTVGGALDKIDNEMTKWDQESP
jgi:hypothetical protein